MRGRTLGRDGLILAGDVSSRFSVLRETLQLCKRAFAEVSFVPGNHDVWVTRGEPAGRTRSAGSTPSTTRCDELGVHGAARTPAFDRDRTSWAVVWWRRSAAWHHAAFDREPDDDAAVGACRPPRRSSRTFTSASSQGCRRQTTRSRRPSTRATMAPSPRCAGHILTAARDLLALRRALN